ncbi:MAG: trigger factor [Desulfobulbaceae bacterium]|nr:trigger factor [Desulfobulbaceae bacterium]
MQVTVEDVSSLTKRLKIVLPQENVASKIEAAYRKLASDVSIKGFRKGKVPRKVLEKSYGDRVKYEVSEELIQETYFDALEQTKIDVVVHPEITAQDFAADGSFVYAAEVDVRPQFELGQFKGLEVEQPEITVSDEEVSQELERLRWDMAPLQSVEGRPVQDKDMVIIDFQGYHEGAPMAQVVGENYSVEVGSGRNGKEFEEQLIGLNKDDETSREIAFPPSFANPILAGKNVEFKIRVKDVKERALVDFDDEFAKDVDARFETLDALKAHIREQKQQEKEAAQSGDLSDKLMVKLLEGHDFEVPKRLVTYEVNEMIKEMDNRLQAQGLTLEAVGLKRDKLDEQYRAVAEKRVRGDFLLKKIAEQESIKVTDEDVEKGFERVAGQYKMPVEEVKRFFAKRDDLLPFMNELLNEKILKLLRDEASIKLVAAATAVTPEAQGE